MPEHCVDTLHCNMIRSTRIIYSTSFVFQYVVLLALLREVKLYFVTTMLAFVICLNATAYVWAVVVTAGSWKSEHFNTRAKSIILSQLFPFTV